MRLRGVPSALFVVGAILSSATAAQDSRPSPELGAAVEAYFDARGDADAESLLEALLRRPDAGGAALRAATESSPPGPPPATFEDLVPYRDGFLGAKYAGPAGRAADGPRLPVLFDVSGGGMAERLGPLDGFIVATVPGYTPPEFSDEGRDAFLKVLRRAAWRMRGDPGRLWLAGFSWAAHASFDTALHRPHEVRGIVAAGGGPRRVHFRLMKNLRGADVRMFCGEKDDPELVWNLRETARLAPDMKFLGALSLAPDAGHRLPLPGMDEVGRLIAGTTAIPDAEMLKLAALPLHADGPLVASRFMRFEHVDAARVEAPKRIAVDGRASHDAQRRATLKGYEPFVAKLVLKIDATPAAAAPRRLSLTLEGDAVRSATVLLRAPLVAVGDRVSVRVRGKAVFDGPLEIDGASLLREARRSGDRLGPVFRAVFVAF